MIKLARVIILEGPDGGGKTTLARRLKNEYHYTIVKTNAPAPSENVFKTYTNTLLEAIDGGERVVFDRHYLGERVYGPLLRGGNSIGDQGIALIERLIAANDVRVVICCPRWSTLMSGWREKDDLLKKESQLRSVRDAYMSEARRLGLTVYDWTGGGLPLLASPGALPTTMTGYRNAEILFVGERAGKKTIVWDLPFHNTTGSARYLWDALQLVRGWEERRGAWLNAYASDETSRDLATSIKTLPRLRKVIALGERAAEACHAQGVKVHPVPHPQYWRRFHHNNVNDYAELLEAAIR